MPLRWGTESVLRVECPNCGYRDGLEFTFIREAPATDRPWEAGIVEWRRYLYFGRNTDGWTREQWLHGGGCGRYLTIERNRSTNALRLDRTVRPATDLER